jgi:hypothetical protein
MTSGGPEDEGVVDAELLSLQPESRTKPIKITILKLTSEPIETSS